MPYIGNQPAQIGAYAVESFNGGGSSFTLSKSATTETVLLFIDGVRQTPTDAYSVSGTTLTTTATTPSGTNNVTVQFLGDVVDFGEPSDNSVTSGKIVDGTIVNADINASAAIALSKLSTTGTPDSTTFLRGDGAWSAAGSGFNSVQVFTASGTWTRPSGVTKVYIRIQGAGSGGAGGSGADEGPGGSAGAYCEKFLDVSSISSATITVGAAGSAGSSGGGAGGSGGASSWADGTNTISCGGGTGPSGGLAGPGAGGTTTSGDVNINGQEGGNRVGGGKGASSILGVGGTSNDVPRDSSGFGSGGAGANGNRAGKAGRAGVVIVQEYK